MFALYYRDGCIPMSLVLLTAFIFFSLCIPQIILCVNYYNNDRKRQFAIDFDKRFVIISMNKVEKKFCFEEISKITKIGANLQKNERFTTIAPWRYFYYYKIELRDKSTFYLTRFLIQKLEKIVPNLRYKYQFQRFPMIKDFYKND